MLTIYLVYSFGYSGECVHAMQRLHPHGRRRKCDKCEGCSCNLADNNLWQFIVCSRALAGMANVLGQHGLDGDKPPGQVALVSKWLPPDTPQKKEQESIKMS